ncbi:MAG: aspartate-semialdehyde dehydrogenase [Planctomycetota bacterium]
MTTRLGLVGAAGAVGQELLGILTERRFPITELRAFGSRGGGEITHGGASVPLRALGPGAFDGLDLVFFATPAAVAREWAPRAVAAGCTVIDNSSAFREEPDVPLVVPEVNAATLRRPEPPGLIANPNCSTILLVLALAPLHRAAGLSRVVVSTYQAASGAGHRAVQELRDGVRAALEGRAFTAAALPHSLAFNLFAAIGTIDDQGSTGEEAKILRESRRILDLPDLPIDATCVRVPVERCHSESVTVELARDLSVDAARAALAGAPGVIVVDGDGPQPVDRHGRDEVGVGRLRRSRVFAPGLAFWLVGDQLRKGAALNAVQIAENL